MKKGLKRLSIAGCIIGVLALTIGILNIIPPKYDKNNLKNEK